MLESPLHRPDRQTHQLLVCSGHDGVLALVRSGEVYPSAVRSPMIFFWDRSWIGFRDDTATEISLCSLGVAQRQCVRRLEAALVAQLSSRRGISELVVLLEGLAGTALDLPTLGRQW
jgi:hypothetical protein